MIGKCMENQKKWNSLGSSLKYTIRYRKNGKLTVEKFQHSKSLKKI